MNLDHAPGTAPPPITPAGIVHDLGNLIQIASSAIAVVARTPDMPAVHSGPILRRARNCLDHAGVLVRQSIGAMRNRELVRDRSNITACLIDVATLVDTICESELVVKLDVQAGLPEVRCEPLALHSAVLNLVLNARDAMASRGVVIMTGRALSQGNIVTGVEITIADNGVGMSQATIANAFDPFFTTKSDGLGGVGLPMVQRFARDMGGEIVVESELGVGTTVTLRLPAGAPVINEEEDR